MSAQHTPGPQMLLHLTPNELGRVFHVPSIEIDAGDAPDFVTTACNCFLLWQSEYPSYLPRLEIVGMPAESARNTTRRLTMSTAYKHRRWSDQDKHLGPFLYSRDRGSKHWGIVAISGGGDEDAKSCHLRMHAFGHTLICDLPPILKPWRQWVDMTKYDWHKGPSKGYWDVHAREYGFNYSDGFLRVFHGAQTHDSTTDKTWCWFVPWTQWHFHRHAYFGLDGELLREWIEPRRRRRRDGSGYSRFEQQYAFKEAMPKVTFEIEDFDGERIKATTLIEQRDYTFGEGWFQWLRFFRRNQMHRSLDISFDKEVGPEKGSWKGGTVGHGIAMLPGELHEAAFRRYCEQEHRSKYRPFRIKFVGVAA